MSLVHVSLNGTRCLGYRAAQKARLDVAKVLVQRADGEQAVQALFAGLADPDEQAGGEGHAHLAGRLQSREPGGWLLQARNPFATVCLAYVLARWVGGCEGG